MGGTINDNEKQLRVRPGFALVVFGTPALALLAGTMFALPRTPTTVLTAIAWAAFLGLIALQGFWVSSRNAFQDFHYRYAEFIPLAVAALAAVSFLVGDATAGYFGGMLAFCVAVFVPYWQDVGRSRPFRLLDTLFHAASLVIFVLMLYSLVSGASAT